MPGISQVQQSAAQTLGIKLRDAIDLVDPQAGIQDHVIHPDLSLGEDDEIAEVLHQGARLHQVVSISYYSESSGRDRKSVVQGQSPDPGGAGAAGDRRDIEMLSEAGGRTGVALGQVAQERL